MSGKPARPVGAAFRPARLGAGSYTSRRVTALPARRAAILAVALLASVSAFASPAGAATQAGLRARADAIASRVSLDNAELQTLGLSYVTASSHLRAAVADERRSAAQLASLAGRVRSARATLTRAAVDAYVDEGAQSAASLYLTDAPELALTGTTYLHAANDVLEGAIVAYGEEERVVTATLADEQADIARASSARSESLAARDRTLSDVGAEQALLSSVNGQLAAVVAADEAARERAAEAAQAAAAARAAAAAQAAAASTAAAGATTTTVVTAGPPPVNAIASVSLGAVPPSSLAADFAAIRNCESGGDYTLSTGNGYYGAYQFSAATWTGLGGVGYANQASPAAQDAAAYQLYQREGWAAWPECAAISGIA